MSQPEQAVGRSPHRRWRFRIGIGALIAVLCMVVVLSVHVVRLDQKRRFIEGLGSQGWRVKQEPLPPRWLYSISRRFYAWYARGSGRVAEIVVPSSKSASPAELDWILKQESLKVLHVRGVRISDEELERIGGLDHLWSLVFDGSKITDEGIEHLKGLSNLRGLNIIGSSITDAGARHLSAMTGLESLDVEGSRITNKGLGYFTKLTRLRTLDIAGTKVTGAGLEHLKQMPDLGGLVVDETQMTLAGIDHLAAVKSLKVIKVRPVDGVSAAIAPLRWRRLDLRIHITKTAP